jgi:hypothetical protein
LFTSTALSAANAEDAVTATCGRYTFNTQASALGCRQP